MEYNFTQDKERFYLTLKSRKIAFCQESKFSEKTDI